MAYHYRLAVLEHWYFVLILEKKHIWIYPGIKIAQIPTLGHVQIKKGAI